MQSPPGWCLIEDGLARCTLPILRQNLPFLQAANLGAVVDVSGEALDAQFSAYLDENSHIAVHRVFCESRNVVEMEEWIKSTLELLFFTISTCAAAAPSTSNSNTSSVVLLLGNAQDCIDCLVVACMRRFQDWSVVSILSEFRLLQGPLQQRSMEAEQFVEYFDVAVVDVAPSQQPNFIVVHRSLLIDEERLLARCREKAKWAAPDKAENVDDVLSLLFFSPPGSLFSPSASLQYDPTISICTDRDDDD